ncbi:MAG: protein kinase [Pseudomonadota bacterium]
MENLTHAIRQLRSGALARTQFLAQLDRVLESSADNAARLREILSEENATAPLPPDLYLEVQRRIERLVGSRLRLSAEDTYVQTRPNAPAPATLSAAGPGPESDAAPERMKGVGDTLNGRFVLEECIGFGGMGTVYKALDLRKLEASDRKPYIAIKVLNVQFRGHPKSLVALQREARKAQALAHPNIVSVYDFDRDGAMVYITMEYLSGRPLSRVLRASDFHGMPFADALRIVDGMGKALAYAHEHGFVHCDFKPANVIVTDSGAVKVIDFGIARVFQKAEEEVDVTVFDPGSLGALTPAYASPEMLEQREPDPRDDIYALACITYELLTGRHPFDRMSATQARAAGMQPLRPASLDRAQWRGLKSALSLERATRTPSVARFLEQIGPKHGAGRGVALAAAGLLASALAAAAIVTLWPSMRATQAPPTAPPVAAADPLAAATAALAALPCSALFASMRDQALQVEGLVSAGVGETRLKEILADAMGSTPLRLDVQTVSNDKCALITVFAPYWTAHRRAGGGLALRLMSPHAGPGNNMVEGDALTVELTTPGAESYVALDYYMADGSVAHLLPNLRARENLAPPHHTALIGDLGNWVIGKPFGTELLVLLTTPMPLFASVHPETEPGADYLRAVQAQLAQIAAKSGPGKIGVEFTQITTRARQR